MKQKKKLKAFTLAEVLIALGIIGIVAAMTIPNLVQNYRQKMWDTASNVFEKKLNDALKVMNTQGVIAQRGTTENFINELSKYMKIIKTCDNNHISECFSPVFTTQIIDFDAKSSTADKSYKSSDLKKASDLKQSDGWTTNTMGVIFGNGVSAIIAYNDKTCVQDQFNNQFDGMSCLAIVYDTSGNSLPNTMNKDVRSVNTKLSSGFKLNNKYWSKPYMATWDEALKSCKFENIATLSDLEKLHDLIYGASRFSQLRKEGEVFSYDKYDEYAKIFLDSYTRSNQYFTVYYWESTRGIYYYQYRNREYGKQKGNSILLGSSTGTTPQLILCKSK